MKRYIRSSSKYDRLKFEIDGQEEWLPAWFAEASDEEIERAKKATTEARLRRKEYVPEYSDDEYVELNINDLKAEGFSKSEIDEIVAMIENGHTVDSAIQRQLLKRR